MDIAFGIYLVILIVLSSRLVLVAIIDLKDEGADSSKLFRSFSMFLVWLLGGGFVLFVLELIFG